MSAIPLSLAQLRDRERASAGGASPARGGGFAGKSVSIVVVAAMVLLLWRSIIELDDVGAATKQRAGGAHGGAAPAPPFPSAASWASTLWGSSSAANSAHDTSSHAEGDGPENDPDADPDPDDDDDGDDDGDEDAAPDSSDTPSALEAFARRKYTLQATSPTRLVREPGFQPNFHTWRGDPSSIRSALGLPRVFPRLAPLANATRVCVFNRTPRQRSLWTSQVLALFGSGRFAYASLDATDCQFFGKCEPGETLKHAECNVRESPTVGLVEWVKCCFHDRFERAMQVQRWDVAVATGDEYCASVPAAAGRAQFRFYHTSASMGGASYLPLGPREEFRRVKPHHLVLVKHKRYLFNFLGSVTSPSRTVLARVLNGKVEPPGATSFVHVIQTWSKEAKQTNGYVLPGEYRRILINSTFTLCPDGHNPEAYRIFEACEAGSIPILALDEYYADHACRDAFAPLIESGAPFVYLNSWTGLAPFLAKAVKRPDVLQAMQANLLDWFAKFMRAKAAEFERALSARAGARLVNLPH